MASNKTLVKEEYDIKCLLTFFIVAALFVGDLKLVEIRK